MARILADLPDEDVKWLDQIAAEQRKSRASVLREAVAAYREEAGKDWLEAGFGLWARHGVAIDAAAYERQRRAEWTRPWDDDYEEVRAESPEMFTPEDDRERAHFLALAKKAAARKRKRAA
ncbi:ribbon-helix-helix protein, CopG family [Sphingomonas sp.]|uniref:ribbon-helix-helix protein, CopG family n=1 Tax=Sphingomonas sp. TaxID=28214 RepID=UPI00286DE103|nr:ribbon-helix-helix protein, CopG family [Sphingomonas sp.]